jgi:ABC-type Fe2+-enterobactin transport system substrate-binding protein
MRFDPYVQAPLAGLENYTATSSTSQGKQKQPVAEDPMDMAAFERAFDAARQEMLELDAEAQRELQDKDAQLDSVTRELQEETNHLAAQELEKMKDRVAEMEAGTASLLKEQQLTDHRVPDPLTKEQQKEEENPEHPNDDELSQVAGQLLDSVSHETSDKFQSSVFLQLMRRLRDKEVRVEGEEFVEVSYTW